MKKSVGAALLVMGLTLTGCSSGTSATEKLGIEEFAEKITDTSITVLDVRTPMEFAQGHIDRAVNIDFQGSNFEKEVLDLDKDAPIAVYCRSGNRSSQAVKVMEKLGFTNLYDMDGGVIDWAAASKPLFR
ncbi:MAG: rhodanese-like domain-containing protein [Actinobacteria bacterium]|jgi:rhodanese-related sulfurtransferase|nr:rhodanese-like domain-containing protein [Actinomycetota bacterium]MDA2984865.1 rhodanese-like domain-containing protein [Actinomycetota bacterium]